MLKLSGESNNLRSVYGKIKAKIKGIATLEKGERIIKQWRRSYNSNNVNVYAGQIYGEKVLPNGNIQKRITTAHAEDGGISTHTKVYSPDGKLLNAYYGVRLGDTLRYVSGIKDVEKAVNAYKSHYGNTMNFLN